MKDMEISNNETLAVNQYDSEKKYWLNTLSGELVKSIFPYDHADRGKGVPIAPAEINITFPVELSAQLITLGTGKDHRIHMVLLTALTALLRKYTGGDDITVGVPIYKQEKETRFINTALALRFRLHQGGGPTFKELLLQVRQTLLEAVDHQNYPLDILVYQLGLSYAEDEFPLFDIIMQMENIHDKNYIRHLNCNMVFSFLRTDGVISGKVEYNSLRYDKSTVNRIVDHFTRLLTVALAGIDTPLNDLEISSPEEKQQLLYQFNGAVVDYPKEKTLSQLFAEQVTKTPDNIAIIDLVPGHLTTPASHHITYRTLQQKAIGPARLLNEKGVKPDDIVALLVKQPLQLVIGIMAAIAAGGAYMPIDPDYPPERRELMLKDSNAIALLKSSDIDPEISAAVTPVVLDIDQANCPGTADSLSLGQAPGPYPASLAYVLYTSGSTGAPKGVMVDNQNVVRLVKNTDYAAFSSDSRILQNGSPVFDALTFELWGALLNGGQLILADKEYILDSQRLGDLLKKQRINMLLLTPMFFNQLALQDSTMFSGLQWLLVGGEALSPRHINLVRNANQNLKVVNAYGPTENTTISTSYLIDRDFEESIPIGRPINNSTAYILDIDNRLQPTGVSGELCVGGDGLARGYMNNPELTNQKFILPSATRNPFEKGFLDFPKLLSKNPSSFTTPPSLLYKTGDLARWLPQGTIEFLGRKDYQVKIRGHRIEPGEIENRLLKYPGIKEAIVILTGITGITGITGDKEQSFLSTYFVADRELTDPELRDYLKEALPDYMVPTYFVQLEKLPLTPTGKIDRKALPDPKTAVKSEKTRRPPANEIEATILQTWSEILGLDPEKISTEDDFFDLGGNSINIISIQVQLRKKFCQDIAMTTMFLCPTIKSLAEEIMKSSVFTKLEYVVKLNNGKNKKNIFIFHPLHGMVYPYKDLAKLLEDRFNVYGIQARGLSSDVPLPETYEDMLKDYLAEIQTIQPKGPYIFSGFCIGNALAYDAVREMEDRGEQVEKIIMLDVGTFMPQKVNKLYKLLRIRLEQNLFGLHLKYKKPMPEQLSISGSEEEQRLMKRVKANNGKLFRRYRYKRIIHSPIVHIRARENLSMLLFQRSWLKKSSVAVKLYKSTGTHHNMLAYPHVEKLAKIFKAVIE